MSRNLHHDLPRCIQCGNTRGPWVPNGDCADSGAQLFECAPGTGCRSGDRGSALVCDVIALALTEYPDCALGAAINALEPHITAPAEKFMGLLRAEFERQRGERVAFTGDDLRGYVDGLSDREPV